LNSYGFTGFGQKIRQAAIYADTCGHKVYWFDWTDSSWNEFGGGGLSPSDTTGKWFSWGYRSHDSVYFCKNTTCTFIYKDSVGSGGTDSAIAALYGLKEIVSGTTRYFYVDSFVVESRQRGLKIADSLAVVFNASIALKKDKSDSAVNSGSYTTRGWLYHVIDSLSGITDFTDYHSTGATGIPLLVVSTSGSHTGVNIPKIRDSTVTTIAGDSGVTIATHDSVGANALQTKYRTDTMRNRIDTALDNKMRNYGGAPGQLQGLASAIPSAASYPAGTTYLATDTKVLYRNNGSSWDAIGGAGGSQTLDQTLALGNTTARNLYDSGTVYVDSATPKSILNRGPAQIGDTTFGAITRSIYTNGASVSLGTGGIPDAITGGFGGQLGRIYNFSVILKGRSSTSTCKYAAGDSSLEERIVQAPNFNISIHGYYIITVGDGDTTTSQSFWNTHLGNVIDTLHIGRGWPLNRIIVIGPIYRLGNPVNYRNYDAWSAALAPVKGFKWGSIYYVMKWYYDNYTPGDTYRQSPISSDSLHPSMWGHTIIQRVASHLMIEEHPAGNLLVLQNAVVKGNDTVSGNRYTTGVTTPIGGLQNPANNVPINIIGSPYSAANDYSGLKFIPYTGSSYIDSFSFRHFATSTTNRAGFGLYTNGNPIYRYNQGITVWGGTAQAAGYNYTIADGGLFMNGNSFVNGQLKITGAAGGSTQQWLMVGQRALNSVRMGFGVDGSSNFRIFASTFGYGVLGFVDFNDTTTFTESARWYPGNKFCVKCTAIPPFPYSFWVNGNTSNTGFVTDSSFHNFFDTAALSKRFSYTGNVHGTYTTYSLIDKAWYDSTTAVRITAAGGYSAIQNNTSSVTARTKINFPSGSGLTATDNAGNTSTDVAITSVPSTATATTQTAGDNSTKVSTTQYVDVAVAAAAPTKFSQTADGTVTNTNSTASIFGTGTGSQTISANTLTVGKKVIVKGFGYISTDASVPTLTITFKNSSSNAGNAVGALLTASMNNAPIEWDYEGTVRSTGASGSIEMNGWFSINGTKVYIATSGAFLLDTTTGQTFDVSALWGTASTNNTIVTKQNSITVQ